MKRIHQIDMTTGSIPKKLLQFTIPLMLTGILQDLFYAADTVIVGRFAGAAPMAAVGSTGALIGLLTNLFMGISAGVNVVCARHHGSGDTERLRRSIHTSLALAAVLGLLVCCIGFFLSAPVLRLMNTDQAVLPLAALYLKIYFLGTPATMLYNFAAAIFRSLGDSSRPMKILTLSGAVNIVLNLIFVVALGMDVAGVALATVLSQYLSLARFLACLLRADGPCRLELRKLGFDRQELRDIVRIGLPSGLNSTIACFADTATQSAVNSLGAITMAANAAAVSINNILAMGVSAFSSAAAPFTSQCLGARRYDRLPKIFAACLAMAAGAGLLLSGLARGFGTSLLRLYVSADDPARDTVIAAGLVRMNWVMLPYFLRGMQAVVSSTLRGLGKSWAPFAVSILGNCGLRILWVRTVFAAAPGAERLYACYPISWLLTLVVLLCILLPALRGLKKQAGALTAAPNGSAAR